MRQILLTLLLFTISLKSFSQSADEFKYITSSSSGSQVFIHFVKDNYGTKEFWLKFTEPIKTTKSKNGKLSKQVEVMFLIISK
jgi:hypothetical protein